MTRLPISIVGFTLIYCTILFPLSLSGATPPTVFSTEGTVRIQRDQKKVWEDLTRNDQLKDNDIIETYFQSRVVAQYGVGNVIILGSNTRVLFNTSVRAVGGDEYVDVNITIFSGGALIKNIKNSHVGIYTSNAVGVLDSGTLSTIVESKTNHTGFQSLSGKSVVRNIEQQQGNELSVGMTTIVLPGKEPTATLYMTYRHLEVLRHFFGATFIDHEIEVSGITPTEDVNRSSRSVLTENTEMKNFAEDNQSYPKLFSLNSIYGLILEDREKKKELYRSIQKPDNLFTSKSMHLELQSLTSYAAGGMFPVYRVVTNYHKNRFSWGLNLPLAKNATSALSMNIGSFEGILDKIDHLSLTGRDSSWDIRMGALREYTIAQGLVVGKFSNKNIYTVTQPLGFHLFLKKKGVDFTTFIADLSRFSVGGLHIAAYPANVWIGTGYYYDTDQYKATLTTANSRFIHADSLQKARFILPHKDSASSAVSALEINTGVIHHINESFSGQATFQFSSLLGASKGYVIAGPAITIRYKNIETGVGYVAEKGKMLYGHFSPMYMSNRLRYVRAGRDTLYYHTQNNMISEARSSYGFDAFYKMTPKKGLNFEIALKQDLYTFYPFMDFYQAKYLQDTSNVNNNFSFSITCAINEQFWKPLSYAKLKLQQTHGGYYPKAAAFFASWGFEAALDMLTAPIFWNSAFEAGIYFTYVDFFNGSAAMRPNDNIEIEDTFFEFYFGMQWGFL